MRQSGYAGSLGRPRRPATRRRGRQQARRRPRDSPARVRCPAARREPAVTGPAPPPLEPGLEQLLRRMRLPYMRRAAPEVLATAKAQRWDPPEAPRVLLAEEVAGRGPPALAPPRAAAPFPTASTVDPSPQA